MHLKRLLSGVIFSLVGVLLASSAFAEVLPGYPATVDEALNRDATARVIVSFAQDGEVEQLQQASARFKPADAPGISAQSADHPDARLARAIEQRAQTVVSQVQASQGTMHNAKAFKVINAMSATVNAKALEALRRNPNVESVSLDVPHMLPEPVTQVPDEPMLSDSNTIIGADTAWSEGYTGQGWYVAILDTGVRTSHEMFTSKTIVEACFSTNTGGDTSYVYYSESNCPNGNDEQKGSGAAAPNTNDHGTHCAGIATGNNQNWTSGEPRYGVAPDADLLAIQVFSYFPNLGGERTWNTDQIRALEYIYSLRNTLEIASASMSLGGGQYGAYCDGDSRATIIEQLRTAGIATVIANGNDYYCSDIGAPACISYAIAVGATDKSDNRASYSNFNATMQDVYAPGSNILSATTSSDSAYSYKSGTSMATPHVAGAFALLRSKTTTSGVTEMESALESTGTAVPSTTASCANAGNNPRINVDQALDQFLGIDTSKHGRELLLLD